MNRNSTRHYQVELSTGEVYRDKCRNSFGGFDNFVERIAKHIGCKRYNLAAQNTEGTIWASQGITATITETTKDGMLIG